MEERSSLSISGLFLPVDTGDIAAMSLHCRLFGLNNAHHILQAPPPCVQLRLAPPISHDQTTARGPRVALSRRLSTTTSEIEGKHGKFLDIRVSDSSSRAIYQLEPALCQFARLGGVFQRPARGRIHIDGSGAAHGAAGVREGGAQPTRLLFQSGQL